MNTYTKVEIKDGRLIHTKVQEEEVLNLNIETVEGNAILTHIGAYQRLKFIFNNELYISEDTNIAISEDKTKCISLKNINFDKDIEENWKNYMYNSKNRYWIEAI